MLAFKSLKFKTDVSLFNKIVTQNINKLLKRLARLVFYKRAYDTIDRKILKKDSGILNLRGILMKIYRLDYQHHKDIVDDNVLTVFVAAKNKSEVEAFAKKLSYSIETITKLTHKEFEEQKAEIEHYKLEHADQYLD